MSGNDSFSKKASDSIEEDPNEDFPLDAAGYNSDDSINRPHPEEAVEESMEEDPKDREIRFLKEELEIYKERMALDDEKIEDAIETLRIRTETVERVISKVCGMRLRKWCRPGQEKAIKSIFMETRRWIRNARKDVERALIRDYD